MPYQDFTGTVAALATPTTETVGVTQKYDSYKKRYTCTVISGRVPTVGTTLTIASSTTYPNLNTYPSGGTLTVTAIEKDTNNNTILVLNKPLVYAVQSPPFYVNNNGIAIALNFTIVGLYSELTAASFSSLPAGTYSIGKYYSPYARYRDISNTVYYKTTTGTSGSISLGLNLYSEYSNFTTSQDLTGNYIGNCLNTLEVRSAAVAVAKPMLYSPTATTDTLYTVLLDNGLEQQTSSTIPVNNEVAGSKSTAYYTTTFLSNSTNTISIPESVPAAYSTSTNNITIPQTIKFTIRLSGTAPYNTISYISGTLPAINTIIRIPSILGSTSNPNNGFTVTAIDTATGTITISPSYSGMSYSINTDILAYLSDQDVIVKLYSDISQDLNRVRAEHRIALVGTKTNPRANATINTLVLPKTTDGSLIIPPAKSDLTDAYSNNSFIICRSNLSALASATTNDISECPALTFAGYNTNNTNSLDYTSTTISDSILSVPMTSGGTTFVVDNVYTGSTTNTIKITIGVGTEVWYNNSKIGNITNIVFNTTTGRRTVTMNTSWPSSTGNYQLFFRKTYNTYTLDPETPSLAESTSRIRYAALLAGPKVSSTYSLWTQNECRWLSAGFYTISPYYTVRQQDGTLIGSFTSKELFESVNATTANFTSTQGFSPRSYSVWRDYYPKIATTNTGTIWYVPTTVTTTTLKLAKITRAKLMELYYTYGPCVIEIPVQILQRTITGAARTAVSTALDYTPSTYIENTYNDTVRFNLTETIVPISTPTIDLIRPSALLAFSNTPNTYKFSASAARLTSNYRYEVKYIITSINTSTNVLTIPNHGFNSGDFVRFNSSSIAPTGLVNNNYYYVGIIDTNNIYLCTSYKNAVGYYDYLNSINYKYPSTAIDITNQGGRKEQYLLKDIADYTKTFGTAIYSSTDSDTVLNTKDGLIKNTTSNTIQFSTPHKFQTGDKVLFTYFGVDKLYATGYSGGVSFTKPTEILSYLANVGLTDRTYYYIIKIDDYNLSLATTYANAIAEIPKSISPSSGREMATSSSNTFVFNSTTKHETYGRLTRLPNGLSEVTDKTSGYIGFSTDVSPINAAPTRILTTTDLSGITSLDINLYSANRTNGGILNKVTIPVLGSSTTTPTSVNSAQLYALSEVAFLPSVIIKHMGIPLNAAKDFTPYSTLESKIFNQAPFSDTYNNDFVVLATDITGSGAEPLIKNSLFIPTGHKLTDKSPIRVSTSDQTSINSTNYNSIVAIKLSSLVSGDVGSLLRSNSAHNYSTGDLVMYQKARISSTVSGSLTYAYEELVDVLLSGRKYYVIVVDAYWFKIADSLEAAKANKGIVFNTLGSFNGVPVNGVDTTSAIVYFKYAQTKALSPAAYTCSSISNNVVKTIYNQTEFDKVNFTFKLQSGDPYAQQVRNLTSAASGVFNNIVIGYFDNLTAFPKNINCYDTYYAQIVDANRFRLTRNYADTSYIPIEPGTVNVNVYTGVTAPTSTALIVDSQVFGTKNPLVLSLGWTYSLGTGITRSDNIDGFIVYVSNSDTVGTDPTKDYMYTVPYDDQYATNKYGVVLYNLPVDYFYVAVAAYRYRNNYDYRHKVFFSSDAREFQRSTLLKAIPLTSLPASTTTTSLLLADGSTYTTVKKYFIPNTRFNYDLSQGYSTATISNLTIDGKLGTLAITKGGAVQTTSQFTSITTATDYIPYISTEDIYKYISSKDTITYSQNIVLPALPVSSTYGSTSNKK